MRKRRESIIPTSQYAALCWFWHPIFGRITREYEWAAEQVNYMCRPVDSTI